MKELKPLKPFTWMFSKDQQEKCSHMLVEVGVMEMGGSAPRAICKGGDEEACGEELALASADVLAADMSSSSSSRPKISAPSSASGYEGDRRVEGERDQGRPSGVQIE